ncbi:MAG: hypothetical protein CFH01_00803 [Alphaproteobacteria bacterium MarineAlpha2_Bin1]|nr:MAG: hypothetical protein CFH01_00803 [Alphaproteobacteria bacterium MarineAlpha2_Bin1]
MQDFFTKKMIFLRKKLFFFLKITLFFTITFGVLSNAGLGKTNSNLNKPVGIEKFLTISFLIKLEDIYWDMKVDDIIKNLKESEYKESKGFKVGYCYFRYSIEFEIKNEPWEIWLCQDEKNDRLYGISIEKGFNGIFFEKNRSKTKLFNFFKKKLENIYGSPNKIWEQCHNTRWNFTEQYSWYLTKTTISFIIRDVPLQQMAIHFHKPTGKKDYGPGICAFKTN